MVQTLNIKKYIYLFFIERFYSLFLKMNEAFENAVDHLASISGKLKDADLLYLYARYKVSTVGECNVEKPSIFDLKGRKKW